MEELSVGVAGGGVAHGEEFVFLGAAFQVGDDGREVRLGRLEGQRADQRDEGGRVGDAATDTLFDMGGSGWIRIGKSCRLSVVGCR